MSQDTEYPDDFFKYTLNYTFVAGELVPDPKTKSRVFYYLHHTFNIFVMVYGILTFSFELAILKDQLDNVKKITQSAGMVQTHLMGIIKASAIILRTKRLKNLRDILNDDRYKYEKFESFIPGKYFVEQRKTQNTLLTLAVFFAGTVGVLGLLTSLLKLRFVEGQYFPSDVSCQEFMPYPIYIFFSTETVLSCQFAVFLYFIGLETIGFQIGAFDCSFVSLICNVKAHFLSNGEAFKTIRERCLVKLGYSPQLKSFKDAWVDGLDQQMKAEAVKCTKHLQMVLGVCKEIEALFGFTMLVQVFASVGISAALLCTTASQDSVSNILSSVHFYCAVIYELYLGCYFGNELSLACESIRSSIIGCDWYAASKEFKSFMIITLSRIERPVYITVAKVSPLTLETFVRVMKASFSVFTLYRSVTELEKEE